MCDLLGMSFNMPVRPKFSFKNFRYKDRINPDGWGLAFYPDKSAQVIKEEGEALKSLLAEKLVEYEYIRSKIIIAHVRAGTEGLGSHKNIHPFQRELNGREYVFAHNGDVREIKQHQGFKLNTFKPLGDTSSEYAFCYILQVIKDRVIGKWNDAEFKWLESELKKINEYGKFNCIFSDGELLFCYADINQHNHLSFIRRKAPFGEITLLDLKTSSGERYVNLDAEKDPNQEGFIIATIDRTGKPTDESWEAFKGGELQVFENGKKIYPYRTPTTEGEEIMVLRFIRGSSSRVLIEEISNGTVLSTPRSIEVTKKLFEKGLIRRSPRNLQFDNNAYYCTTENKRDEIDELIKR